jgi:hypothetical protein
MYQIAQDKRKELLQEKEERTMKLKQLLNSN